MKQEVVREPIANGLYNVVEINGQGCRKVLAYFDSFEKAYNYFKDLEYKFKRALENSTNVNDWEFVANRSLMTKEYYLTAIYKRGRIPYIVKMQIEDMSQYLNKGKSYTFII